MTFEQRFANWMRWCNSRGLHQGQCGSAEGNWKSPQVWEGLEPKGEPVNVPDALELNSAFWKLPEYSRRVIKFMYFRLHWRRTWIAQKLGVHHTRLDEECAKARKMFKNLLDLRNFKHKIAA